MGSQFRSPRYHGRVREGNKPEYQFSGLEERPWLVLAMRLISTSTHAARPGEKSEIGCKIPGVPFHVAHDAWEIPTAMPRRGNPPQWYGRWGGFTYSYARDRVDLVRIVSMDRANIPGEPTSPCRTCPFRSVNGSAGLYLFKSPSPVLFLCYISPLPVPLFRRFYLSLPLPVSGPPPL